MGVPSSDFYSNFFMLLDCLQDKAGRQDQDQDDYDGEEDFDDGGLELLSELTVKQQCYVRNVGLSFPLEPL
jgi:hypothetical protein